MRVHKRKYLFITKTIDVLLCWLRLFWASLPQNNQRRDYTLYIVENFRIGDSIMARPAIDLLFQKKSELGFGKVELIASLASKAYLSDYPWDAVHAVSPVWGGGAQRLQDLKDWSFPKKSVVLDLKGDVRNIYLWKRLGAKIIIAPSDGGGTCFLSHDLGPADAPHRPHQVDQLNFSAEEFLKLFGISASANKNTSFASKLEAKIGADVSRLNTVSIQMSASRAEKEWDLGQWHLFIEQLIQNQKVVQVFLGPGQNPLKGGVWDQVQFHSVGLQAIPPLLESSAIFVGVDSFLGHMASSLGLPAIILFGPFSNPDFCSPRGRVAPRIIQRSSMSEIKAQEVFEGVQDELKRNKFS